MRDYSILLDVHFSPLPAGGVRKHVGLRTCQHRRQRYAFASAMPIFEVTTVRCEGLRTSRLRQRRVRVGRGELPSWLSH